MYEPVYIAGEVDQRIKAPDRPWLYATNLGVRYATIFSDKAGQIDEKKLTGAEIATHIEFNRNEEKTPLWFNVVPYPPIYRDGDEAISRKDLLDKNQAIVVLLGAWRNHMTGGLSDIRYVASGVYPQHKAYALG